MIYPNLIYGRNYEERNGYILNNYPAHGGPWNVHFHDFRYKGNSGLASGPTGIRFPDMWPDTNIGTTSVIPKWESDYLRLSAAVSSGSFLNLGSNFADSVSSFLVFARVRINSGQVADVFNRGRDGSGAGWSVFFQFDNTNIQFAVVTTSGGAAAFNATVAHGTGIGEWVTVAALYNSANYLRVWVNGSQVANTNITTTTLRNSSVGIKINSAHSTSATGDFDLRLFGLATGYIPTDFEMMMMHLELMELEKNPMYEGVHLLHMDETVANYHRRQLIWT